MEADRSLLTCWLPTSPVTCQQVTEGAFCTVTARAAADKQRSRIVFWEEWWWLLLTSLLEWLWWPPAWNERLKGELFLSMGALQCNHNTLSWHPWVSGSLSIAEQNPVPLDTGCSCAFLLPGKKRHKRDVCPFLSGNSLPIYWFLFSLSLLFQIIFSLVWLGSSWKVEWSEICQFWGEGVNDLP